MRVREAKATIAKAEAEVAHLRSYVLPEERELAREEVHLAQCNLDLVEAKLESTRLVAPIDGTVLELLKREGESVTAETREPVIVFADLSRLRVRAEIDERNAHGLREGQAAVVFGRNLNGQRFQGRVSCVKRLMGGKTVFARTASERKDLDAVQVFIDFDEPFVAPVGLRVDVAIQASDAR
jgi:multidrug resistance efflux pump